MPSIEINQMAQREWRQLGFFDDRDDEVKEWKLIAALAHDAVAMRSYRL